MYKINVKVEGNKVDIISQTVPITSKSLNTIKCVFDLPTEYKNLNCVAVFTCVDKTYKEMIVDNECMIPKKVLSYDTRVKLGVYAFKEENLIYSPTPVTFKVEEGSYTSEESDEEIENHQSSFDKLVLKMEEINENLENIVGSGENGNDGFSPTIEEKVNDDDTYILEITTKDDSFETPNLRGKDGANGKDGRDGADGINGKDGTDGVDGQDGKSAYQIAVDLGFEGSEQEWLDSLKSETLNIDLSQYAKKEDLNKVVGNINSILDEINGEVIDEEVIEDVNE